VGGRGALGGRKGALGGRKGALPPWKCKD